MKILSKKAIKELRKPGGGADETLCDMAEQYRRYVRQKQRDKRRKRSPRSGCSTGYFTLEQFARLIDVFGTEMSRRDRLTQTIIIILAESGLRSAELCNLQMRDLPCYHGHSSIEVRSGKGGFRRTVVISQFLARFISGCVGQNSFTKTEYFLKDERGGKLSYPALYQRIKRACIEAGLPWAHPHILRHTFTTHLKEIDNDIFFLKRQLGHRFKDTTAIYAHDIEEISKNQMERFHNRLWSHQKQRFLPFRERNS